MPSSKRGRNNTMETPQKSDPAGSATTPTMIPQSQDSNPPSSMKKKRVRLTQPDTPGVDAVHPAQSLRNNSFHVVLLGKDNDNDVPRVGVVIGHGYIEYALTKPIYDRNKTEVPQCANWVEKIECVKHVMKPIGPDGKELTRPNKEYDPEKPTYYWSNGKRTKQPATWPVKGIAFCINEKLPEDKILEWINETLIPNFEKVPRFDKNAGNAFHVFLQDPAIVHKTYWSDFLSTHDIVTCLNDEFDGHAEVEANIKSNPGFLYEIWPRGQLPIKAFTLYNLKKEHVDPEDWTKFVNFSKAK